jgi:hypothetical protein
MPPKTHPDGHRNQIAGVARHKRRHRRKFHHSCALLRQQGLLELGGWPVAQR